MSAVAQSSTIGIRMPMSRSPGSGRTASTCWSPHPRLASRAQKIAQLTGEFDREGWNGTGTPRYALNRTENRFNIVGTDLGASFSHQGRLYFLFGDTWRVGHSTPNDDLDAIAFCTDTNADDGLELTFLPRPPMVPGIAQDAFNVPLDGVSWNGKMYVFFSTDRRQAGIYALMGRSILARSDNGLHFKLLYEVSRFKFINVSTMIVDANEHGLPGDGPQLAVFGRLFHFSARAVLASCRFAGTRCWASGYAFTTQTGQQIDRQLVEYSCTGRNVLTGPGPRVTSPFQ